MNDNHKWKFTVAVVHNEHECDSGSYYFVIPKCKCYTRVTGKCFN